MSCGGVRISLPTGLGVLPAVLGFSHRCPGVVPEVLGFPLTNGCFQSPVSAGGAEPRGGSAGQFPEPCAEGAAPAASAAPSPEPARLPLTSSALQDTDATVFLKKELLAVTLVLP